ncbi:MAG: alpha/beta fold hydrolase [Reyranella sp.]|uniref:alpha/beta fold hydrolase n=1 Tax=Reyranella sp. TaxID=1929291 RepID=UPI003D0C0982
METLDVGGVSLEVHIAGSGPPLLYLHAEQYVEQVTGYLAALARNWTVIAPRHPGYGTTSAPTDFRSVDDLAYLYLDLLDKLKHDRVVLVGASLGGWIALEMCVRNRTRLSNLVLVSSVGVKFSGREERDFADLFYMPDIEAFPLLFADPKRHAPNYAGMSSAQLEGLARERQMLAHYGWRPYLHNPGLRRWLHRADLPTLVLWGESDGLAKPAYGRLLASTLPAAEFSLIQGAGHYPEIEQPDAVIRAIDAFVAK